jgi:ClpP class serine protease
MSHLGNVAEVIWGVIGIFVLAVLLLPYWHKRRLVNNRLATIRSIERKRKSRVITIIHRQETMTLLGFPIYRYIDIEDSEQVLRAIRLTPPEMPLDLILHTPGGLVLASEQIACALKRHPGKVTIFVPHYAMSGGTLIALAANEIIMDHDAVLGPVDPQLGTQQGGYYPAASIISALREPNPNRDDQTLILGDMAKKAVDQVYDVLYSLIKDKMPEDKAKELAKALSDGHWTHDYPISFEELKNMGLSVNDKLPPEVHGLMELYPQSGQRRPSVEFIPTPYLPPLRRHRKEGSE